MNEDYEAVRDNRPFGGPEPTRAMVGHFIIPVHKRRPQRYRRGIL